MFNHFTLGTQARPAANAVDAEPHLSPKQGPRELDLSTTLKASLVVPPSPDNNSSIPPQPIDNLVDELNKQTLLPRFPRRPQRQRQSGSSSIIAHLSSVSLEVDDDCQMDLSMNDAEENQPVADWKRSRRQWLSLYAGNPNNACAMEARLRDMLSDKSQYNVIPAPTSSSTTSIPTYSDLPRIEVGSRCNLDHSQNLEADEGFVGEDEELMRRLMNSSNSERILSTSGGLRQYGALRFRGSAETALRCQNVVRHRPRMRKRKAVGPSQEPRPT